ncbi:MAG: arginase family protein [Hyphomicrobiaceae bacterium]
MHADLRDGYLGEHYSHAAAMRRVLDHQGVRLVQAGIRAMCREEADCEKNRSRIDLHLGLEQRQWDLARMMAPLKGKPVYITVDIDGLDGSIMPATGRRRRGLDYLTTLAILRGACEAGKVVGMDLVELAPIEGCTPTTSWPRNWRRRCSTMRCRGRGWVSRGDACAICGRG